MPHFRPFSREQPYLIPQDLQDWIPKDHLVRFVADLVGKLDLSCIRTSSRPGTVGRPTYHPVLMISLLIYADAVGIASSRKIEKAIQDRIDFRWLAGGEHPDHDCIAAFRKKNIEVYANLFAQVLLACRQMGLVTLGRVAIDGSKMLANASRHKTYSASELLKLKAELQALALTRTEEAIQVDEQEDARYGQGNRGDELPPDLADVSTRLAKIDEALATLQEAVRMEAARQAQASLDKVNERAAEEAKTGKKRRGPKPKAKSAAQIEAELFVSQATRINLTDPDSHLMLDGATKAIVQGYNAQAVVDCEHQIIVAAQITEEANDKRQLVPMLLEVEKNLGRLPDEALADTGYFSEQAVTDQTISSVRLLVPPGRDCTQGAVDPVALEKLGPPILISEHHRFVGYKCDPTAAELMKALLQTPDAREAYKDRGTTVEPVFGQVKAVRGFRGFLLRGLECVRGEWNLICLGHNILKMYRASQIQTLGGVCPITETKPLIAKPSPARQRPHFVRTSVQMALSAI